jgi:hypothetical protein
MQMVWGLDRECVQEITIGRRGTGSDGIRSDDACQNSEKKKKKKGHSFFCVHVIFFLWLCGGPGRKERKKKKISE